VGLVPLIRPPFVPVKWLFVIKMSWFVPQQNRA